MDPILTYATSVAYLGLTLMLLLDGSVARFPVFGLYLAAKGCFLLLAWVPTELTRVIVSEIGFPVLRWLVVIETFFELAYWMNSMVARYALVFLAVFSLNGVVFALVPYPGTPLLAAFRMARQLLVSSATLFILGWVVTYLCARQRFSTYRNADVVHLLILAVYIAQFPIAGMVDRLAQLDRDRALWRLNNQVSFLVNLGCLAAWALLHAERSSRIARSIAARRLS